MAHELQHKNYALRLLKGDIPLVYTYWIGFALTCGAVTVLIEFFIASKVSHMNKYLLFTLLGLMLVYTVFILISVYNSATKYQGWQGWKYLAKGIVLLNFAFIAHEGYEKLWGAKSDEEVLKIQFERLSQKLPITINEETLLVKAHMKADKIYYDFQLTNVNFKAASKFNQRYFKEQMKKNICNDKNVQNILQKHYTLIYNYLDKFKSKIIQIKTTQQTCKKVFADEQLLKKILEAKI